MRSSIKAKTVSVPGEGHRFEAMPPLRMSWPLLAGALIFTLLIYARTLWFPFVYDDWVVIDEIQRLGALKAFLQHLNPMGALTYRPLAWAYFAGIYSVFGLNPIPFHVLALLLHAINGLLAAWIGTQITGNRSTGILAGALFIALHSLHVECLLWLVGFYDIGAMTFTLGSLVFFIQGRHITSAGAMACALLTKEASAFLPILILIFALLQRRNLRLLLPHAAVTTAYAVVKSLGRSPFGISLEAPHAMGLSWTVLRDRASEYAHWMGNAFVPVLEGKVPAAAAFSLMFVLFGGWLLIRARKGGRHALTPIFVLVVWGVLALAPVLLLKNQSAKYYAVHAAVPMVIATAALFNDLIALIATKSRSAIMVLLLAGIATANFFHGEAMYALGLRQRILNDGYFHLVKRIATVEAIRDSLTARHSVLPSGTTVVVAGAPLDAVGGSRAVRFWYNDSTLHMTGWWRGVMDDTVSDTTGKVFIDLRSLSGSE